MNSRTFLSVSFRTSQPQLTGKPKKLVPNIIVKVVEVDWELSLNIDNCCYSTKSSIKILSQTDSKNTFLFPGRKSWYNSSFTFESIENCKLINWPQNLFRNSEPKNRSMNWVLQISASKKQLSEPQSRSLGTLFCGTKKIKHSKVPSFSVYPKWMVCQDWCKFKENSISTLECS